MHFKTEILLQNMQIYASLYHKCNFPPFSRVSLQECMDVRDEGRKILINSLLVKTI